MKELIIIAGPHGVGKNAFALSPTGQSLLQGKYHDSQLIYNDLLSHHIGEASADHLAHYKEHSEKKVISYANKQTRKNRSFSIALSLNTIEHIDYVQAHYRLDYKISLYFIGMQSWKKCRDYIRARPDHWAFPISDQQIHNNYYRSLATFPGVIPYIDKGYVLERTSHTPLKKLLGIVSGRVEQIEKNLPDWLVEPLMRCL